MMMCRWQSGLLTLGFGLGLMAGAAPTRAEILVTARETHLAVDSVFGSVDASIGNRSELLETSLDSNLIRTLQGADNGSGASGDVSWIASYDFRLDQEFLPNLGGGFGGSSSVSLFAFSADAGIASLSARPGSRLVVGFLNTTPAEIEIHSVMTSGCTLSIDRVLGGGQLENVLSRTGSEPGEVSGSVLLEAGEYVATAESQSDSMSGSMQGDAWSFELTPVPEPGAGILLASGSLGVACCARRRRPQTP